MSTIISISSEKLASSDKGDDLVSVFGALSLSGNPPDLNSSILRTPEKVPAPSSHDRFVGGFALEALRPGYGTIALDRGQDWPGYTVGGSPPEYCFMQSPDFTMPVPHILSTPILQARAQSTDAIPLPALKSSNSNTSATPPKLRAGSAPPSTSTPSKGSLVQCIATASSTGVQCRNPAKFTAALSAWHPDADANIQTFCHNHGKVVLDKKGFYSHKVTDQFVKFSGSYRIGTLITKDESDQPFLLFRLDY